MSTKRNTATLDDADKFVGVGQAAAITHLSEPTIRRYLTQKKLRRYKCGVRTLLDRAEVLSLIKVTEA